MKKRIIKGLSSTAAERGGKREGKKRYRNAEHCELWTHPINGWVYRYSADTGVWHKTNERHITMFNS